mgnify:CR=1 FL=1
MRQLNPVATGKRIRELRMQRNIKVNELARLIGLESDQAIYKWQRGDSMPSMDNVVVLSEILGVPLDEIIVRDDPRMRNRLGRDKARLENTAA